MRRRSLLLLSFLFSSILAAQGVAPEWDARKQLDDLKSTLAAIAPEFDKLSLNLWREANAPEAYFSQLDSAKRQIPSLVAAIDELRLSPDRLSTAVEIFLRFDALDQMQRTLMEAIRKYDTPTAADAIEARFVANAPARDRFRRYLVDLAADRDRQFDILSREAQRCRTEANLPSSNKPAVKPPLKPPTKK